MYWQRWAGRYTTFYTTIWIFLQLTLRIYSYDAGLIKCSDTLDSLHIHPEILTFTVDCPKSCLSEYYSVYGSGPYRSNSNICCSSVHNGTLNDSMGGKIVVEASYKHYQYLLRNRRNGVETTHWLSSSDYTFITKKLQQNLEFLTTTSITTGPTTTTISPSTTATKTVQINDDTTLPNEIQTLYTTTRRRNESHSRPITDEVQRFETLRPTVISQKPQYTATTGYQSQALENTGVQTTEGVSRGNLTQVTVILEKHFLGLQSLHGKILVLIAFFLGGAVVGASCWFLCRRCVRKHRPTTLQRRRCSGRRGKTREPYPEGEICVCYQNMDSSKQGLLYDPETCDRPCPIRQPNRDLLDVLTPIKPEELKPKQNAKCEIRYEDDCATACSGACNPQDYEF